MAEFWVLESRAAPEEREDSLPPTSAHFLRRHILLSNKVYSSINCSPSALPLMRRVYAAALYLTEDRADADDLLQETYLRAYRLSKSGARL